MKDKKFLISFFIFLSFSFIIAQEVYYFYLFQPKKRPYKDFWGNSYQYYDNLFKDSDNDGIYNFYDYNDKKKNVSKPSDLLYEDLLKPKKRPYKDFWGNSYQYYDNLFKDSDNDGIYNFYDYNDKKKNVSKPSDLLYEDLLKPKKRPYKDFWGNSYQYYDNLFKDSDNDGIYNFYDYNDKKKNV
ncbi:MAG: hypothetical protein ABIK77_07755, partial [candidate division WOR-3 bacterium]